MSPLAPLFLLACVSLAGGFNPCSTLMLGKVTSDKVYHRQRTILSPGYFYVPDECVPLNKKLLGQEAIACEIVGYFPPGKFGAGSFSPLYVNCTPENALCNELLTLSVTQFCTPVTTHEMVASPSAGRNINKINSETVASPSAGRNINKINPETVASPIAGRNINKINQETVASPSSGRNIKNMKKINPE